jgi:virginiamycin B lyase
MLARGMSPGLSSGGLVRRGLLLALPLALLSLMLMAAPAHAYLYFGQGNGSDCPIGRANLNGRGLDHSFIIQATCGSPAVDARHIYWIYVTARHEDIARANIDGTGVDGQFIAPRGGAGAVAVDHAHIYWSSPTGIGRANLDGSGVDPTFLRLRGGAMGLAVDSAHIYWADQQGIGRANLNGTHPTQQFISAGADVTGIAVDSAHIYWTNFGGLSTTSPPGTIGRANLDGSGVNRQFITGPHDPSGIAVEGSYIYWANYGSGTIGRAQLDGSAANENFIRHAGATGLAVDAGAPSPGGAPRGTLRGAVTLNATGGRIHGYTESVNATFGSLSSGQGGLELGLVKVKGVPPRTSTEFDTWGITLNPTEYALNRSRVYIDVVADLGPDGQVNFTFTGRPHPVKLSCGQTANMATGILHGTIRIRTGERFFKTVIIRRVRATVLDTPRPTTPACHRSCEVPFAGLSAFSPFGSGTHLGLTAVSPMRPNRRRLAGLVVNVDESISGTAFSVIEHSIAVEGPRAFFRPSPNLGSAILTTPGRILTGRLSIRGKGALGHSPGTACGSHPRGETYGRGARITGGRVVATFDSIGKWMFGPNLTIASMTAYRRV